MTSSDPIALPPDLGQVLAFPGIWLEPPAGLPAAPRPRVRRPGRVRRAMVTILAFAAGGAR